MIITKGSTPTIVFLLVSAENGIDGVDGLANSVTVKTSKNGSTLAGINVQVNGLSDGWYSFALPAAQSDTDGPLIVTAKVDDQTLEWRDLHQVVTETEITLSQAIYNRIADHVLRRNFASASGSGDGDDKKFRSLLGSVAKDVNRVELEGTTLRIYEADDKTVLGAQTVVTNQNAAPIVGIDTDSDSDVSSDISDESVEEI